MSYRAAEAMKAAMPRPAGANAGRRRATPGDDYSS